MAYTARELYTQVAIENSQLGLIGISAKEFNTYCNKAIILYCEQLYSAINTIQSVDDQAYPLFATYNTQPELAKEDNFYHYRVILPVSYSHILNCYCSFKKKKGKCEDADSIVVHPATRATADTWAQILVDYYQRPSCKRPYYKMVNPFKEKAAEGEDSGFVDDSNGTVIGTSLHGTFDGKETSIANGTTSGLNFKKSIMISSEYSSDINSHTSGQRINRPYNVCLDVITGKEQSYELDTVTVEFLKSPQTVCLTEEQLALVEDTSQILEWSDNVCINLVNNIVTLLKQRSNV